ncbi:MULTISPECIES: GDP-L-fucose synthase [unclassified Mannheimia]|uniref:GDP-L-fucose synthase n=1 Tax=unclassified Mannheimia TaxID=2645054 RepID=UPI00359E3D93
MKKLTILGLGWLGLPLAVQMKKEGWRVVGSKRMVSDMPIECYPLDLNNLIINDELETLLAADTMVIALPPSKTTPENYLLGIQQLVSSAIEKGLKHIIFTSSTSVLPMESGVFDEIAEIDPTSLLAKVENWLLNLPIHCDIVRLAGLVGKKRHPVFYLAGKQNLTGAEQPVNLVHLEDCIAAISLLLAKPNGQRIFHLCAEQHPTRKAYYSEMAKRFGLSDLQFSEENRPLVRIVKAEKIRTELGFVYRYPNPYDFVLDI